MSSRLPGGPLAARRARVAAALAAVSLLAVSFAFLLADRQPPTGARVTNPAARANLGGLAAQIQANIAAQRAPSLEWSWQVEHHEVPDPEEAPPPSEAPAIASAGGVLKRWLLGYLLYEVDKLGVATRQNLVATSTVALARSLLEHPPLLPPTQGHTPPEGRMVDLITTIAAGGRRARAYLEVAYGLERVGFHLTLTRGGVHRWLVAAFTV
jgi:hypothetical protein